MEIERCKQLFHPTSRSDRSFDELQKSDRDFISNRGRSLFSDSGKRAIVNPKN
ncbi:hypothetical protein QUB63_25610 [Microcoleus sp. ARI1-B5]|uniref:hypothetical protein n=1 Tax=unclassified Microcoleus TaxID=2642155 RepID=UPI002FD74857